MSIRRIVLNPPPNFITFIFYRTYSYFLITSKMPDARQPDLKNGEQALRRIRHTPQGDAVECNAAGGILMVDQGEESILVFWIIFYYVYKLR